MAKDNLLKSLEKISAPTISRIISSAYDQNRGNPTNTDHGRWVANTTESLDNYICKYWRLHHAKQDEALTYIYSKNREFFTQPVDVIDWGCGQGLASISYMEFCKRNRLKLNINNLTLIDASQMALTRAESFCRILEPDLKPQLIVSDLSVIKPEDVPSNDSGMTIHFLSNILDLEEVDYRQIFRSLVNSQSSHNLIFCISTVVGYNSPRNLRLGYFVQLFKDHFRSSYKEHTRRVCKREGETCRECPEFVHICHAKFKRRDWTRNEIIFEVNLPGKDAAKVIDFPPVVIPPAQPEPARVFTQHFQAAYALDPVVEKTEYSMLRMYIASNSCFTLSSRSIKEEQFSRNRSVYSVLANQVMRGVPTFLPADLAEAMAGAGNPLVKLEPRYGTIRYGFGDSWPKDYASLGEIQSKLIWQGIRIARIQLCVLVYLIHKETSSELLKIRFTGEQDPAVGFAVDSLNVMLDNMGILTGTELPRLSLIPDEPDESDNGVLIICARNTPETQLPESGHDLLVLDVFGQDYYAARHRRRYYSGNLIKYEPLFDSGTQEFIPQRTDALKHFLRSIFRKQDFIEGQLGILRHTLGLNSVIGLLPTGGGKSLTYQLSVLMQPGFSLVIEPIKSLMEDQHQELKLIGIDSLFINSNNARSLNQANMIRMQNGQSLFTLISPERMQIQEFRDALMDMVADDNYFSYFIVDEAHCVSEWGHDFRPSYLRLAVNANRYCKPFDGSDITVIGLTATASYDVLTDVQTELEIESPDQIEKSISLKREEIIYRFIPVVCAQGDFGEKYLDRSLKRAKINILAELLEHRLEEDLKAVADILEENSPYRLQGALEITNDTGIIVFCPHATGLLGVVSKNSEAKDSGIFEHLSNGVQTNPKFRFGYYRGGEERDTRQTGRMSEFQQLFKENKINVMVATKAFGMGFNKPNVRFSIHMNYPGSIEGFAQETGRAGRDRKLALAYLLYSDLDVGVPEYFHGINYPGVDEEMGFTRQVLHFKNKDGKSISQVLSEQNRTVEFVTEMDETVIGGLVRSNLFGKIIYRLALVGIIDDYTICYSGRAVYRLFIEAKSRQGLRESLKSYLLRYYTEKQADAKVKEFFQSNDGNPTYTDLIRYYIQFEYDFIKLKREQAIRDMDFASKYGLDNQDVDPLSDNFREYIDAYFSSKYFRENYQVDGRDASITKATDRGKVESEEIVAEFIDIVKQDSGGLISNSKELRGACIRLLNDNPNNYSLRILNAFTNLIVSRKKTLEFNQGIKELIHGVNLYMRSKDRLMGFGAFSDLLSSFWQSITEEIPDLNDYLKEKTGYSSKGIEQLLYLKRTAEILSGIIKEEK